MMRPKTTRGFQELYLDANGKWARKVANGCFHFIDMIDWVDAVGEKEAKEGGHKYTVELSEVDLLSISEKTVKDALDSFSADWINERPEEHREMCTAEALFDYGVKAPLESFSGNSWHRLVAEARKASYAIMRDPRRHEELMDRPVNGIGSTAREFMQGDFMSAMERGVRKGDAGAKIMAKMHGIAPDAIAAAEAVGPRPSGYAHQVRLGSAPVEDPLAYAMGFMHGEHAQSLGAGENRDDLAPAYLEGYRMGVAVRKGEAERPTWIQ